MAAQTQARRRYSEMFRLEAVPTVEVNALKRGTLAATRLRCDAPMLGRTAPYVPEATFMVSLQLRDLGSHPVYRNGRHLPIDPYPAGTLTVHDLRDDWQADLLEPFDVFHCHVPLVSLRELADEQGGPRVEALVSDPAHGTPDRVMEHLVHALLPALDQPRPGLQMYIDHLMLTMRDHVALRYGGLHPAASFTRGGPTLWQLRRACDFMLAHLTRDLTLDQVARECGLSVGYFIRAFKRTAGTTPHQWLMRQRAQAASELLVSNRPLAQIAVECGFSDQAHMSRVFSVHFGSSPGRWRRRRTLARPVLQGGDC